MRKIVYCLAFIIIFLCYRHVWAFRIDAPGITTTAFKTIVIDPGHGGIDSGATGPSGTVEKEINLAIAKRLFELLSKRSGMNVVLTRSDDTYISLSDRTDMANKMNADLFISIHSNAAKRSNASGAETYFLSLEASDDEARSVAAFENGVVKIEMGSMENSHVDDLKAILWDMTKTETLKESSNLAEMVQDKLSNLANGEIRGVKQAPFIVLTNATMPAVLIEVGFITNQDEEQKLSSKIFQNKIAKAIYDGIKNFEAIFTTKTVFSMGGSFND